MYFLSVVECDQLLGLAPERSLLALTVLDPFESFEGIWRVVQVHRPPVDSMKDSYTSWLDRICKRTKLDESPCNRSDQTVLRSHAAAAEHKIAREGCTAIEPQKIQKCLFYWKAPLGIPQGTIKFASDQFDLSTSTILHHVLNLAQRHLHRVVTEVVAWGTRNSSGQKHITCTNGVSRGRVLS